VVDGDVMALCFLLPFFLGDVDGQGGEYASRVARSAVAALAATPAAVEPVVPAPVPLLGSAVAAVLSLGVGVGVDELGVDVGELDEGETDWLGLVGLDGVDGAVSGGMGDDEAQLLGLLDAEPVAPVPELLPTAWLACVWLRPLPDDPPVPPCELPERGGPELELGEMACGTSIAM
jgi:hypothetical protein